MGKLTGEHCAVFFAGFDLTGRSRQFDFNQEWDEEDMTAFQDGSHNSLPSLPKGSVNVVSFLDGAANQSHVALKAPGTRSGQVVLVGIGDGAAPTVGDVMLALQAEQFRYQTPLETARAVIANWNAMGEGHQPDDGILLINTTITNTTNGTAHDHGAATAEGGAGYLEVVGGLATDTYAVKIQHAPDAAGSPGTWADLLSFTLDASARSSERVAVAAGTTVNQWLRVVATRTGAAADNFRLAAGFARH